MTVTDQIYLSTGGMRPDEVAARIASVLGMDVLRDEHGVRLLRRETPEAPWFGGDLDVNGDYVYRPEDHTPDEDSVSDGYDIEWSIGSSSRDEDVIHATSREFFDKVAARLPWPALLVEDVQRLKAASRPGTDVVEFPPHTSPDSPGREVWEPYALPR